MIENDVINKFLRDIVNTIIGTNGFSIKGKQNAPRPSNPYCDVQFVSGLSLGWEQQTLEDNDGDDDITETMSGQREKQFSLNFYRDSAYDNASKVRNALVGSNIISLFAEGNIGLIRRSEVRDLSESFDKQWEERSQMDIFLNVVGSSEDVITSILGVNISGEVQSNSKEHNLNVII